MTRHTFKRRDGSRFELVVSVDHEKLAENLARKMLARRKTAATRCDGSIKATIKELPE